MGTCSLFASLPRDLHLKIVSLLTVSLSHRDVCAMGSCSRYWRELCASNCVWKQLSFLRWSTLSSRPRPTNNTNKKTWPPNIHSIQNWKDFYYRRHLELRSLAESQTHYYLGGSMNGKLPEYACKRLASYGFSFVDVVLFCFRSTDMVFINMIGLLYCIKCLKNSRKLVAYALVRCKICRRRVVASVPSAGSLYRALVPTENRDSVLTLEDVALGRRGKELAWQNQHLP